MFTFWQVAFGKLCFSAEVKKNGNEKKNTLCEVSVFCQVAV